MNNHLLEIFNAMEKSKSNDVNDRVLIIDGTNTYLRIFSSVPMISENGEHVGGIIGFLRSIALNIREFNPSRCIIVFDGKGGSMRRKKLYPYYKANRSGKYNLRRDVFSSVDEEQDSMRKQLMRIAQYLELLPVQIFCIDNIEADDAVAYITSNYYDRTANKIRIVSTDRDFLQLVSDKVEVYSPVKKKLYTQSEIQAEYGFHPENYLIYRTISGDTSDNINGVSGVGLKTLLKFFPELSEKKLSHEYLLSQSKKVIETEKKPKKIYQLLLENQSILNRNYDLMQLHDVEISGITKIRIMDILQGKVQPLNKLQFKRFLAEDYLHTQFKDLDNWLYTSFNSLNIWANS